VKIETTIEYYWQLKAIDSVLMSAKIELPEQERQKIVDVLIDNTKSRIYL
jgi:hypothetical protein